MLRQALPEALKAVRVERRLTQEAVAHEAQVSVAYISYLENARKSPTVDSLVLVCGALKIPVSDLLRRAERLDEKK